MIYYPETKEIKDVCILNEESRFWNAPNLSELVKTIQEQLKENRPGLFGFIQHSGLFVDLANVAFKHKNPRAVENKIYIDVDILHTPMGKVMKNMLDDVAGTNISDIYRFTLTGIGNVADDNRIHGYQLNYLNFISRF